MKTIFRIPPLTGGVNNRYPPRRIGLNQIAEGWNLDLLDPTVPALRPGFDLLPFGLGSIPSTAGAISGAADFYASTVTRLFVVAVDGAGIYYGRSPDDPSASLAAVTKSGSGSVTSELFDPGDFCLMEQGNGLLWLIGRSGNVHALSPDGTLTDCGNENESPPTDPADGVYFLERMWFLKGQDLYYSKLLPGDGDLQPTAAAFDRQLWKLGLSPARGAEPRAVVPWRDEALIVFFEDHIEQVVVNSANPLQSSRQVVDSRLGTISARTVMAIGDAIYFVDQYGHLREMGRTMFGTLRGARPLAVSEPIRSELPGNLNQRARDKMFLVWQDDRLKVFYPPKGSEVCTRSVNLILHNAYGMQESGAETALGGRWECPWVYSMPFSYGITSSARGDGVRELYTFSADTESDGHSVWIESEMSRTDAGTGYRSIETGRMSALAEMPEGVHRPREFYSEFRGVIGTQAEMAVRSNEHDEFIAVGFTDVEDANAGTSQTAFPLTFPVVFQAPKWTALRGTIDEENAVSGIPGIEADFPPPASELPHTGPGRVRPGRGLQYRITSHGDGKKYERLSAEFICDVDKPHTAEAP